MNKSKPYNKSIFVGLILILNGVLSLDKIEARPSLTENPHIFNNLTEVELVFGETLKSDPDILTFNTFFDQYDQISTYNFDYASLFKYSQIRYDNYVYCQLKIFNNTFSQSNLIISVLQKNNTWHQSTGDEYLPLS